MHVWSRWWARLNAHQLRKRITTQTHQTLEKTVCSGLLKHNSGLCNEKLSIFNHSVEWH